VLAEHVRLHRDLVEAIEHSDDIGARCSAARIVALNHTNPHLRTDDTK
jgi:hypothetical protein